MMLNIRAIVIGNANHHNTLSMVRCFGESGYHVDLVCKGNALGCAAKSKYVKNVFVYKENDDLVEFLKKYNEDVRDRLLIITCGDLSTHILDMHYDELKDQVVFFNAGSKGRLTYYQDKSVQMTLAERVGINVPASTIYKGVGKVKFTHYPCLVKPQESRRGGKKILICKNQEELDNKLEVFAEGDPVLIQQYLTKDYEIVLLGLACQGEVFIPGYVRKIRDNKGGTTFSEIHPIKDLNSDLPTRSKAMIKEVGYEGLFGIEYIHSEHGFYFIEINLRNDATCYALAKAGVNLPIAYMKAAMGENVKESLVGKEVRRICSMVELKDFKFVLKGKVSLWRWLGELKGAKCKFYYSKEDMKPLLYAVCSVFSRVLP